jgi:MoxR-like ATPase
MAEQQITVTVVNADTCSEALDIAVLVRRPTFVWGSPGIGKSDIIRQLAQRHAGANVSRTQPRGSWIVYTAEDGRRVLLIDARASQWDAVDTRGVPYVETYDEHYEEPVTIPAGVNFKGDTIPERIESQPRTREARRTSWAPPNVFPTAEEAAQYDLIILFLDELNSAHRSVQAALYQLILDRALGDYVLPDNVVVLAAGNLESDRAVTERMSTALAARFTHLQLEVSAEAWERWALGAGVHTAVISYMRWRPDALHEFDPRSSSKAQPNPRAWEAMGKLVEASERRAVRKATETALYKGTIGEARGAEFAGFLQLYRDLPDPAGVILDPDHAPISDRPEVLWALCGALAERATPGNFDRVARYGERLRDARHAGPEFMTLLVRSAFAKDADISHTRAFIKWASDNSDVLM